MFTTKTPEQLELDRAKFLVCQALEEDESGAKDDAVELYMQAAELCLKLVSILNLILCYCYLFLSCRLILYIIILHHISIYQFL